MALATLLGLHPLHNLYLLFRQAIQLIHQLVYLRLQCFYLCLLFAPLIRGVGGVSIPLNKETQRLHNIPRLKFDSLKKIVIVFQRLIKTKKSRGTTFYHFIEFN